MRRRALSPLPQRHGLDAARLRLPAEGPWRTLREHLVDRLPRVAPERIDAMLRENAIVGTRGPLTGDTPFEPGSLIWFHRDLPDEVEVPFPIPVLYRDERILVVDKPHFLATIPRGRHIRQTALVRLRLELDLPTLSPAHRLDRATAGVLMFVIAREHRGVYQNLFRDRQVRKSYQAIARFDPDLELPRTVRSRIVKERGVICAQELPGPANSETLVELIEHSRDLGRYRLTPHTGRTHQLRVHLSSLGIPILNDDLYPEPSERPLDDFSAPLQLLAASLEFTDPLRGTAMRFESRTRLSW
jgi:tRNA pseudouridine32 synthase/23S rRNA pseudouridine746 synthase